MVTKTSGFNNTIWLPPASGGIGNSATNVPEHERPYYETMRASTSFEYADMPMYAETKLYSSEEASVLNILGDLAIVIDGQGTRRNTYMEIMGDLDAK